MALSGATLMSGGSILPLNYLFEKRKQEQQSSQ
jgi:hypothetical protein